MLSQSACAAPAPRAQPSPPPSAHALPPNHPTTPRRAISIHHSTQLLAPVPNPPSPSYIIVVVLPPTHPSTHPPKKLYPSYLPSASSAIFLSASTSISFLRASCAFCALAGWW